MYGAVICLFITVLLHEPANVSFHNVNNLYEVSLNHLEVARRFAVVDANFISLPARVSKTQSKIKPVTASFKLQ